MSNTKEIYYYDNYGYFFSAGIAQTGDGIGLPDNAVETKPELKVGFWYKIKGSKWVAEKKPVNAEGLIGITVEHADNTARGLELKQLMQDVASEHSDEYRVVRGEDLSMSIERIPEKTLAELITEKLGQLDSVAGAYDSYKCNEMYIISSLGYKINADIRSQTNLRALIEGMGADDHVLYKDYDNNFISVTRTELQTMLQECILNGQSLYAQKWGLQKAISEAQTVEALDKIEIKLTMQDFRKS